MYRLVASNWDIFKVVHCCGHFGSSARVNGRAICETVIRFQVINLENKVVPVIPFGTGGRIGGGLGVHPRQVVTPSFRRVLRSGMQAESTNQSADQNSVPKKIVFVFYSAAPEKHDHGQSWMRELSHE